MKRISLSLALIITVIRLNAQSIEAEKQYLNIQINSGTAGFITMEQSPIEQNNYLVYCSNFSTSFDEGKILLTIHLVFVRSHLN